MQYAAKDPPPPPPYLSTTSKHSDASYLIIYIGNKYRQPVTVGNSVVSSFFPFISKF